MNFSQNYQNSLHMRPNMSFLPPRPSRVEKFPSAFSHCYLTVCGDWDWLTRWQSKMCLPWYDADKSPSSSWSTMVDTPLRLKFMTDPTTSSRTGTTRRWWRLSLTGKEICGLARLVGLVNTSLLALWKYLLRPRLDQLTGSNRAFLNFIASLSVSFCSSLENILEYKLAHHEVWVTETQIYSCFSASVEGPLRLPINSRMLWIEPCGLFSSLE